MGGQPARAGGRVLTGAALLVVAASVLALAVLTVI